MSEAQQSNGMTRRTVVRGAAWVTPVVTVGAAAPAMAASPPPVAPSVGSGSCRLTKHGAKRYRIELTFTNPLSCKTTVDVSTFHVQPKSGQQVNFTENPILTQFDLNAGETRSWTYDSDQAKNISQASVVIHYSYGDCSQQTRSEKQSIEIPSLNPCQASDPEAETSEPEKSEAGKSEVEESGRDETTSTPDDSSQPSGTSTAEETQTPDPSGTGTGGAADSSPGAEPSTNEPTGTSTTGD